MAVLSTHINKASFGFRQNQTAMTALCEALAQKMETSLYQGSEKHKAAAAKHNKLTARERIELLLDADSPFLELMPLAGCERPDLNVGGTLVGGIGVVCGKMCLITANIGTIKGGSVDYTTLQKGFRFNTIAAENRLTVKCQTKLDGFRGFLLQRQRWRLGCRCDLR